MKIKGVTVTLIDRVETGKDTFNRPVYEEKEIEVDNVVYHPTTSDDIIDDSNLVGRKSVYTLAIPKGDTNTWEDKDVLINGKKYHVFTTPQETIEDLTPLSWNKKVLVESYE